MILKNKTKIAVVINNRANYARIKSFLKEAQKNSKVELKIILAGSSHLEKFGNISNILKRDGIKIDFKLHTVVEGNDPLCMAKTTSNTLSEVSTALSSIDPDVVIVIADRYENLAVAIAASYMNYTLAHIQGGEVTGSIDESVRHAITKLSHIHFVCTKRAKKFLIKMGEQKKNIYLTGCPSLDFIKNLNKKIDKKFPKRNPYAGDKISFKDEYIVFLFHSVTTQFKENRKFIKNLIKSIKFFNKNYQVVILWPNIDAGTDFISKEIRELMNSKRINPIATYKNFSPEDYVRLIYNSKCLVGNSSSGIRESSYMGLPVVNIGKRQQHRERGKNVIDVDNSSTKIISAIKFQLKKGKYNKEYIYGKGGAGKKILNLLLKSKIEIQKKLNYLN